MSSEGCYIVILESIVLSVIISCLGSTKSGLSVKSFVIYHSVESTYREVRSRFPEELIYAHYLTLVTETLQGFKKSKEHWKGRLERSIEVKRVTSKS